MPTVSGDLSDSFGMDMRRDVEGSCSEYVSMLLMCVSYIVNVLHISALL